MLLKLRNEISEGDRYPQERSSTLAERLAFKGWRAAMSNPALMSAARSAARMLQGPLSREESGPGPLAGWTRHRETPTIAKRPFRKRWRDADGGHPAVSERSKFFDRLRRSLGREGDAAAPLPAPESALSRDVDEVRDESDPHPPARRGQRQRAVRRARESRRGGRLARVPCAYERGRRALRGRPSARDRGANRGALRPLCGRESRHRTRA